MQLLRSLGLVLLLGGLHAAWSRRPTDGAAARFEAAKHSPPQLRAFLFAMPKGGDLHIRI